MLVTNSLHSNYNNTINKIMSNEAKVNEAVNNFTYIISNISTAVNNIQVQSNINIIFDVTLLTLSFQLDDIINSIMFSKQNLLYPSIVTPTELYGELIDNYRNILNNLELPTTLDLDSVHLIMNTSKVTCYYISNRIIFVLSIPLVSNKDYIL